MGKGGLVSEHVGPLADCRRARDQALMSLHVILSTSHKRGPAGDGEREALVSRHLSARRAWAPLVVSR